MHPPRPLISTLPPCPVIRADEPTRRRRRRRRLRAGITSEDGFVVWGLAAVTLWRCERAEASAGRIAGGGRRGGGAAEARGGGAACVRREQDG
jgi:hypothetical protein